ncbi:MAG: hypothetical protein WCH04_11530 [Gammaproteobacteria bacterium]
MTHVILLHLLPEHGVGDATLIDEFLQQAEEESLSGRVGMGLVAPQQGVFAK